MTAPDPARLAVIAGWDDDGVRSGVAVLSTIVDGLPSWRARVEDVGRRLEDDAAWSGTAGAAAARSVLVLSVVTATVSAGLAESLTSCRHLASDAGTAAALARAAMALGAPDPPAGEALARDAVLAAGAVPAAPPAAGAALSGLGVVDAFAPADFADLTDRILPRPVPVPPSQDPDDVAVWWTGLPPLSRTAFLQQRPRLAGTLDGLPAWARDRANRLLLTLALRRDVPSPTARTTSAVTASRSSSGVVAIPGTRTANASAVSASPIPSATRSPASSNRCS